MRTLRTLLLTLVLVVLAVWVIGYVTGASAARWWEPAQPSAGTSDSIDRARERGAELGEKAAKATAKMEESLNEAGITAKIKAKMALDDSVKARAIDVTTHETTVTLTGAVTSSAERDRAVALARETDGVTRVVDNLSVR